MRKSRSLFLSLALIAAATSVEAVTYIVPTDRDLVRRATAIVVATAVESHAELTASGGVVTRSELTIESVLKGALRADQALQLVEPGGIMSERATLIPGSPRFENGQRYLLFLRRGADGEWSTWGLGLGRFSYTTDLQGRELVSRGAPGAIFGFEEGSWAPHVENLRAASEFAEFVRAVVKAPLAPASETYVIEAADVPLERLSIRSDVKKLVPAANSTRPDYLMAAGAPGTGGFRWQGTSAPMGYCCAPTFQPSPLDGPAAASAAVNNWNGVGTSFSYTAPTVNTGMGGITTSDGMNTIKFNDPNNEVPSGAAGIGGITIASGTYPLPDGFTYWSTSEVDVVMAKASVLAGVSQTLFNLLVTHEVGHTLGFRHSNQAADNSSPCTAPLPCAGVGLAVMASAVSSGLTSLQQWDRDAMNTVYGSGPTCTNPSISVQPQSQTIAFGAQASLSVTAGGSTPLTYQWYVGTSGTTSTPVSGQTSSVFNPSPTSTTNYWVRVSNSCTPPAPADSQTATVTVQPCQGPAITAQPLDQSVTSGASAFLSVSFVGSNPVTVSWFRGTEPDMSSPIGTGPGVTTPALTSTTNFWARLQNFCGNVDTRTVTITVAPCQPPVINDDPQDQTISPGGTANLFVGYSGTAGTVTWFQGTFPDSSSPAGSGQFFMTPALSSTTSFWAQITNSCGSTNSRTVTITVSFGCTSPTITTNPANQTVVNGTSVTLAVVASGTGPLHYAWFQGPEGNETKPVGTDSSSFKSAALTTPTQFWVKVTNSCGSKNSTAATVNLKPGRPRAVKHR